MTIRRISLFSLLLAASACAPATQNRSQLAPKDGPAVTMYATYTGGLFDRSLYTYVSVDRPSYVLVGHLTGEGVIEVMYPESPRDTAKVPAKKSFRTPTVYAPYDGLPYLYARSGLMPIRDLSARINSYDGRGHGYIFTIAADQPFDVQDIVEGGFWSDVEVTNYIFNPDPRRSIRDFADAITRGAPYTLHFANSFQTTTYTSYADAAWTCTMLSQLSLASLQFLGVQSYCGGGFGYSLFDRYFRYARPYDRRYGPTSTWAFAPADRAPPRRPSPPATATLELYPTHKRVRLVGDAEQEFGQQNRAELTTNRTLVAPRRAGADAEASPTDRFDRRPITRDYTPRTTYDADASMRSPRTERAERQVERTESPRAERAQTPRGDQSPRAERPAEMTRVERPHVERAPAPAPTSAPPPAPPRSKPPGDQ